MPILAPGSDLSHSVPSLSSTSISSSPTTTLGAWLDAYHFNRAMPHWEKLVADCTTIEAVRRQFLARVPPQVSDYFEGGAGQEQTLDENVEAFRRFSFLDPHNGMDIQGIDMRTTVLGHECAFPLIVAPVGSTGMLCHKGEALAARAAARAGIPFIQSTLTLTAMEDVASAMGDMGPRLYQLYLVGGQSAALRGIERVKRAGFSHLVLTIDTGSAGDRDRDLNNGSKELIHGGLLTRMKWAPAMLPYIDWVMNYLKSGGSELLTFPNIVLDDGSTLPYTDIGAQLEESSVIWGHLPWISEAWEGKPLVIKGVQGPTDIENVLKYAEQYNIKAIVISNHGGRQLEGVPATLYLLKELVEQYGEKLKAAGIEVLFDGGIRTGRDMHKAISMGADAVLGGRVTAYGVGAAGEAGALQAFNILKRQFALTMQLTGRVNDDGICTVEKLDRSCIRPNPHFQPIEWPALIS